MIEHVSVCVNYLDYYRIAYKQNKPYFDHFIVVTSSADKETQQFCANKGITCVVTDVFYSDGAVFNKGRALNEGLKALKYKEWVCIMDSDSFIPCVIDTNSLNEEYFYGTERVLLRTPEQLKSYLEGAPIDSFESPIGWAYGFFQCFHWDSKVIKSHGGKPTWYPWWPDCTMSDGLFKSQWGDFVPNTNHAKWFGKIDKLSFKTLNLGDHGVNHFGRVSEKFIYNE